MSAKPKSFEQKVRAARRAILRRFFTGKRGRKSLLDALGPDVSTMTLDCGDHVISFSPHELIGRRIFVHGHFDRDMVDSVLAILEREKLLPAGGATVLDIGANIGTQTVYFCKSGKVRQLLAIEPDPRNLRLLRRNVDDNALGDMVKIAAYAVGDFDGSADLFLSATNHGQSSLTQTGHDSGSVTVAVKPVSAILAEAGLFAESVSLIWMDIEGAEPMACRSMTTLLTAKVPLMLEFSPDLYGVQGTVDFIDFLAKFYRRCVHFADGEIQEVDLQALKGRSRQSDILLLP